MRSVFALLLLLIPLATCYNCIPNVTQALVQYGCSANTFEVTVSNLAGDSLDQLLLVPSAPITLDAHELVMDCQGIAFSECFVGIAANSSYKFNYTYDCTTPVAFEVKTAVCVQDTTTIPRPVAVTPTPQATQQPTEEPDAAPQTSNRPRPTKKPTKPSTAPTTKPSTPTSKPPAAPTTNPSTPTTKPTSAPSNTTISGVCSGTPRMLNGKPCASTTRYWDGNEGACGCGGTSGSFGWIGSTYTAAASPPLFGTATWCGSGCGKCYKLTATGYSPEGRGAAAGASITVMVTNLCPPGGAWCSAGLNSFEYGAHFDLADAPTGGLISKLGWDNPEVVYEEVPCSGAALTASDQQYDQCICSAM